MKPCLVLFALWMAACGTVRLPDSGNDASSSADASAIDAALIDASTIDAALPDAALPDAAPGCQGTLVGGACWYKGNLGQSCSLVCASHGGFDPATITFAGATSAGDRANSSNCMSVVNALAAATYNDTVTNVNQSDNYGCVEEPGKNRSELISIDATTKDSSNNLLARFCACNQ